MNFENAEGLEFELSDEELSRGIEMQKYIINTPLFASFNSILYSEQLLSKASVYE